MSHKTLLLPLALFAAQACAQVSGLQRCPTIADPAARLACYDALMPPAAVAPAVQQAVQPPAPKGAAPAAAPAAVAATATATAAATATATPAASPSRADSFGLPNPPAAEPQAIESLTAPQFDGWGPGQRIKLQNGQVWQVTDGSSGTLSKPGVKATVRKGMLSGYIMEFEGSNRVVRVRRVE